MKKRFFVSLLVLVSAGAFSLQRRHGDILRQHGVSLRTQLDQNEQITLQLERQNETARKRLAESEAALLDLETRLAGPAKLSNTSGHSTSDSEANCWRDDVPFVRLSKEHLSSLSVGIIARDAANGCHLAAPSATLLGLSAEELSVVNEAMRTLCEQYLAIELARAPEIPKYQHAHEGIETVFAIPRLENEGAELKRAFTDTLASALGKTRTDLILHYGRDAFWRQLAGFGQNAKKIEMIARLDDQRQEQVKVYVHLEGAQYGGYSFTMPPHHDPNAALCRALWDRAQAAGK
jgi:hypothetical protein